MSLEELRQEIDRIDSALLPLFIQRMECARLVALVKQRDNTPVFNAEREQQILDRAAETAGEYGGAAKMLYASLMDASRALQNEIMASGGELRPLIEGAAQTDNINESSAIACPGVIGSYTHAAALKLFPQCKAQFVEKFEDVFMAVKDGTAEYGVVPVENSFAGSVTEVYDLILKHRFYITGSTEVTVSHCLAALPGTAPEDLKTVFSHPQGLMQCSDYIKANKLEERPFSNTAAAAEMVAIQGDRTKAAICSEIAAKQYGLTIIKRNIQNSQNNRTRFVVISKNLIIPKRAQKISLCFSLPHTTGSLYRILARFAQHNLNLTKIESRPIPDKSFEYHFYLDFTGNVHENGTLNLLCSLHDELPEFSFLGNYVEL